MIDIVDQQDVVPLSGLAVSNRSCLGTGGNLKAAQSAGELSPTLPLGRSRHDQITDNMSFVLLAGETGFDPIEGRLRANVRATIEAMLEEELAAFLSRLSCDRGGSERRTCSPQRQLQNPQSRNCSTRSSRLQGR